jgi:uncharacterized damage-inducible protein DinB
MLAAALHTLSGYNRWATQRLLEVAERLTPEQLHTPGEAGHGSVHGTLLHLIDTQQGWLFWWDGSLSAEEAYHLKLDPANFPDLASLRTVWEEVEKATHAFITGLKDEDVGRVYAQTLPNGADFRMPLWQMMLHVANHGTQHRSEVAAMLTSFGHSPGNLDLLFYL